MPLKITPKEKQTKVSELVCKHESAVFVYFVLLGQLLNNDCFHHYSTTSCLNNMEEKLIIMNINN